MIALSVLIVVGIVTGGAAVVVAAKIAVRRISDKVAVRRQTRAEIRAAFEVLRVMEELGLDVEQAFARQREIAELDRLFSLPAAPQRAPSRWP